MDAPSIPCGLCPGRRLQDTDFHYLLSRDNHRTATPSPKLRQLARRDKYPLLLRLQFPNASSERRALPESGTSVLEWNRAPTLVWQRMPRVALPTEMEAGYRLARANWTRFKYYAR